MKHKVFTQNYVDYLQAKVGDNLTRYQNPEYDWIADAENQPFKGIIEIEIPDDYGEKMATLSTQLENCIPPEDAKNKAVYDLKAAKLIYEACAFLSPMQGAQKGFWTYLAHGPLMQYVRKRWPKIDDPDVSASYIAEHWLYKQGEVRNWLHGLYWSVEVSVGKPERKGEPFDYSFTEKLFTHQNIRVRGVVARGDLFSNKNATKAFLKFREEHKDDIFCKYDEYRVEFCVQLLNNAGGSIDLNVWEESDFTRFLEDNIDNILEVKDRKKQRREAREQQERNE